MYLICRVHDHETMNKSEFSFPSKHIDTQLKVNRQIKQVAAILVADTRWLLVIITFGGEVSGVY